MSDNVINIKDTKEFREKHAAKKALNDEKEILLKKKFANLSQQEKDALLRMVAVHCGLIKE